MLELARRQRGQDRQGQFGADAAGTEEYLEQISLVGRVEAVEGHLVLPYVEVGMHDHFLPGAGQFGDAARGHSHSIPDAAHIDDDCIAALGRQYGARHIRVFGSVARCEERPDSDIDFLVEFPRGYDLFTQRLPLAERLTGLLKRHVDLVPEHELNRHIREQVLNEAVDL